MRSLIAALAAAAALGSLTATLPAIGASPAAGTVVATPRFVPAAGPVLAGDGRMAWVTRRDDAVLDLWVSEASRGPRRVQRFVGSDTERLRSPRLSASATEITLAFSETRARPGRTEHVTGSRAYRGAFGSPLLAVRPGTAPPRLTYADPTGRAVWVTRACARAQIRVTPAPGTPATPRARDARCPLRLRRPARLRAGRLVLGVSCAGFRIACFARVSVRAGGRVVARGPARYNHAAPPYAAARLRLTAPGRRLLRRRPYTRVRITARIGDGASPAIVRGTWRTLAGQLPAERR